MKIDPQVSCADRFTLAGVCAGYALVLAKSVRLDENISDALKACRGRPVRWEEHWRSQAGEMAGADGL